MIYPKGTIVKCVRCDHHLYELIQDVPQYATPMAEHVKPLDGRPEPRNYEIIPPCHKCGSKVEFYKLEIPK